MKCCFTSTETVGLLGTGAQDASTSTFTQLLSSVSSQYRGHAIILTRFLEVSTTSCLGLRYPPPPPLRIPTVFQGLSLIPLLTLLLALLLGLLPIHFLTLSLTPCSRTVNDSISQTITDAPPLLRLSVSAFFRLSHFFTHRLHLLHYHYHHHSSKTIPDSPSCTTTTDLFLSNDRCRLCITAVSKRSNYLLAVPEHFLFVIHLLQPGVS